MSYQRVFGKLICRCDLAGCARVWISESGELPRRCAGCKKMGWNQEPAPKDDRTQFEIKDIVAAKNEPVRAEVRELEL